MSVRNGLRSLAYLGFASSLWLVGLSGCGDSHSRVAVFPPSVTSGVFGVGIRPSDGSINVVRTTNIWFIFSEPVNLDAARQAIRVFDSSNNSDITGFYDINISPDLTQITLVPDSSYAIPPFARVVVSVQNLPTLAVSGNPLTATPRSVTFVTGNSNPIVSPP